MWNVYALKNGGPAHPQNSPLSLDSIKTTAEEVHKLSENTSNESSTVIGNSLADLSSKIGDITKTSRSAIDGMNKYITDILNKNNKPGDGWGKSSLIDNSSSVSDNVNSIIDRLTGPIGVDYKSLL